MHVYGTGSTAAFVSFPLTFACAVCVQSGPGLYAPALLVVVAVAVAAAVVESCSLTHMVRHKIAHS